MAKILVIDDEPSILHAFRRAFDDPDDVLLTAADGRGGPRRSSPASSPTWSCST